LATGKPNANRLVAFGQKPHAQVGDLVHGVHLVQLVQIQLAQIVVDDDDPSRVIQPSFSRASLRTLETAALRVLSRNWLVC